MNIISIAKFNNVTSHTDKEFYVVLQSMGCNPQKNLVEKKKLAEETKNLSVYQKEKKTKNLSR